MRKSYDHRAVEWINEEGRRECRLCPTPITGWGDSLRHINEAVRPAAVNPDDVAAVDAFTDLAARALEAMWTDRVSDRDRARVVVGELYRAGALNTRPRRRVKTPA